MDSSGDPPAAGPQPHRRLLRRLDRRYLVLAGACAVLAVLSVSVLVRLNAETGSAASGTLTGPTSDPAAVGLGRAPSPPASPSPSPAVTSAAPARDDDPPAGPAGGEGCPPFPQFPDETCTGYRHTGVNLKPCPNRLAADGATYDSCHFTGGLEVVAKNVTITRSLIEGGTVYATYLTDWSFQNLTLIDVEIDGGGTVEGGMSAAIGSSDYTCIRCHIHSSERGANLDRNVHIEDSYLHGWIVQPGAHQTAIGSNGGSDFTIIHNTLQCETPDGCSSAVSLYEDFGPIDNVLIKNNLFNTTGGYCTYAGRDATNVRYVDNVFGTAFYPQCAEYGPVTDYKPNDGNVWRGNRYPDGSAVPPA